MYISVYFFCCCFTYTIVQNIVFLVFLKISSFFISQSDVVAYVDLLVFLCILLCRCVYMYVIMLGQV